MSFNGKIGCMAVVRENVCNKAKKRKKSRFLHFEKRVRYPKPPNSINFTILFTYFIVTHRNAR